MPNGVASISTKATRARLALRLAQAWLVPRWTMTSPALSFTVRIVHVHLDLALEHDDVIDRLGTVHPRLVVRREIDDGEPRPVRRRRSADDARTQILDVFADRDVGRRPVGRPDQGRDGGGARTLHVGRRPLHDDLGDVIGIVPGHEAANGRVLFSHDCVPLSFVALAVGSRQQTCRWSLSPQSRVASILQSSLAPTAFTSAPQCLRSSWMSWENCAGERSTRSKLLVRKNSRDCGDSRTLATSA